MIALTLVAGLSLGFVAAWWLLEWRPSLIGGLTPKVLQRVHRAELALAASPSTLAAARELGRHAMALLEAPAAVVLIEGVGETARAETGDVRAHSLYGPGARMRLLDDAGIPCGSIAVAARANRPYDEHDDRLLDLLAQRVSSSVHRLSLFEAVQAEQRTLADILSSTSDGIMAIGPDLRVRSWNEAMAAITGVAPAVALGESCCSVFRPRDEAGEPVHGSACPCRRSEPAELLVALDGADGRVRWLNCAFSPMSDGGSVVVARDVTARKQVDDEKADFLATVSHELRTPLTPIKGFLQTLVRRDGELDEVQRQRIYDVLLREEGRLERLVQQLLQATSVEHLERTVVPAVVDWSAIVASEVAEVRRQAPDRQVVVHEPVGGFRVVGDQHLATSVLSNLLSNALKYSPDGTAIEVTVAIGELDGDRIVTTVRDHGPGIVIADRTRIFDKFVRLGDHLTRPQQGVGLGLFIVQRAVEAMGGTVWVDDAPGGGAAFAFSLPAAPAPRTDARSETRAAGRLIASRSAATR